jgi:hypothetical protein
VTYMAELLIIDNCMVQSPGGDVRNLTAIRKMNGGLSVNGGLTCVLQSVTDEWVTLFCDITPPIAVIPYRRFGTTREGTRNPRRIELHSGRAQISSTSGGSIKSHKVHCGLQTALP